MSRARVMLCALVLPVAIVVGCGAPAAAPSPAPAPAPAPATAPPVPAPTPKPTQAPLPAIVVGFAMTTTGSIAEMGQGAVAGAQAAAAEVNAKGGVLGRKLDLLVGNDEGKPEVAASVVRRWLDVDKIVALGGVAISSCALAIVPLVTDAKVPFMVTGAATTAIVTPPKPWIFRCHVSNDEQMTAYLMAAQKAGFKKVTIYHTNLPYGVDGRDIATKLGPQFSLQVVAAEGTESGATEVTVQASKLKAANPDCILAFNYETEYIALAKALQRLDWQPKVLCGDLAVGVVKGVGVDPIKNWEFAGFTDWSKPEAKSVYDKVVAIMGAKAPPPWLGAMYYSWDSVMFIAEAIKRAGKAEGPAIRDALETMKDIPRVMGAKGATASFSPTNHEGGSAKDMVFYKVVSPTEFAVIFRAQ